ncbi:MAG TPA: hypothetical protein VN737_10210, partial [Bryobacteraceae bacterium]|nr:hypothetical protein [Bryobacteraceae bacterium]
MPPYYGRPLHNARKKIELHPGLLGVPDGNSLTIQPRLLTALDQFFGPDRLCVVTGHPDASLYHLDGDRLNSSVGNLVPLSNELCTHLEAIQQGRRRTLSEKLDPKRLAEKLAAKHFRGWRVASAYGCAALAFYMGEPPYGEESPDLRAFRLCDVIHYARH